MTITIRFATMDDGNDLLQIHKKLGYQQNRNTLKRKLRSILESGCSLFLVVEFENKVIGYIHGIPYTALYAENSMQIIGFYVDEPFDNKEIMNELYDNFVFYSNKFGYYYISENIMDKKMKEVFYKK